MKWGRLFAIGGFATLCACSAPAILEAQGSNPLHPAPEPCTLDEQGRRVVDGPRQAMCCPEGYVAGGGLAPCRKGTCCSIADDMGHPPLMPDTSAPGRPGGGPDMPPIPE